MNMHNAVSASGRAQPQIASPRQALDAAARSSAQWCFPEVKGAFEQVALSLEQYAASQPRDESLFARAAGQLHQGLGALRVMSLAGIDVFADALERVFSSAVETPIAWTPDQVLETRHALMALTEYLDDLIDGLPEEPLLLFPYYKSLQTLSGQARLHPADLFVVPQEARLMPALLDPRPLSADEKTRLRVTYEAGLLKTLRAGVNADLASELGTVLERVAQSPEGLGHYSFWRAAAAVFQAVAESSLAVDLYVKRLVARLNAQLKETLAGGRTINEALYREVLFSLAMARNCSDRVEPVRNAFLLEGSIPEDFENSRFGLYDADAERCASEVIPAIKEAWDLVSQKKHGAIQQYLELVEAFHSAASLLGPALTDLGTTWVQVGRAIESRPVALTEALAVEMATSVLFAESLFWARLKRATAMASRCGEMVDRLQAAYAGKPLQEMPHWLSQLSREAQERSTMSAFIHEAKAGVRQAEEGVDLYLRSLKDKSRLPEAGASLAQIAGALLLLGQDVPSQAARHLSDSVLRLVKADRPPEMAEQERLATSMGALSLFVNGLAQNLDQRFEFDPQTGFFRLVEDSASDDAAVVQVVIEAALPAAAEPVADPVPPLQELPAAPVMSEDDRELREIFEMEALEVLEGIGEAAAALAAAPEDASQMTVVRRGFHTLKGSSRMVQLNDFGEAAWAMEQLLNQFLADGTRAHAGFLELIGRARQQFAVWIEALQADPFHVIDPAPMVDEAQAMRDGKLATPAFTAPALPVVAEAEPVAVPEPVVEPEPVAQAEPVAASEPVAVLLPEPLPALVPAPPENEVIIGDRRIGRQLFNIFIEEGHGILALLGEDLADWRNASRAASEPAARSAHSLKGSASVVGLTQVHLIAERLEQFMLLTQREHLPALAEELDQYAQVLASLREAISRFSQEQEPQDQTHALSLAQALYEQGAARVHRQSQPVAAEPMQAEGIAQDAVVATAAPAPSLPLVPAAPLVLPPSAAPTGRLASELSEQRMEQLDEDLLSLFVEEARDYLPQIGQNLRAIAADPADKSLQQLAMRQLHTVKGGARMAGAMVLGNRVHDMETRIESAMILSQVPEAVITSLIDDYDDVVQLFEAMQVQGFDAPVPGATALDQVIDAELMQVSQEGEASPETDMAPATAGQAEPAPPALSSLGSTRTAPAAAPAPTAQASIRVRADLLDSVVNEAGEVAIVRSRTENAMSSLRQSISDLNENVARLRAQLREIEIQAEVQMQAQIAQARESDNFDPLEQDRYTRFQELTRMLAESVNDVATVQHNINRTIDTAGQDLTRQGQLMRELQQNLMRMRMVAFGSISERLYRVVRQTAKELGKRVSLDIRGSGTELDRNVLERMAGPVEHLLRNAIAHGVEGPEARLSAGKSETGELMVNVRQDGNEVVLAFRDDGAGLNLPRIRAKAIERGLMSEFDELSDSALGEMIFMPGFSTAESVNQIAGRGVGMDVVLTEVQSLGGRIETHSDPGKGTEFTIYLPLTLAVTQVVLVRVGEHRFAIPSGSVEQVLPLKPQPLVAAYEAQGVQWQDQKVPLQYFGTLLELSGVSPEAQHYSPVLIARAGQHRVAIHVDEVLGNEEVVVKNVGQQVARVPGIAGATVLGDGQIVLIVNPVTLAQRQDRMMGIQVMGDFGALTQPGTQIDTPPSVLVVDDSLTVRKVTQRLLKREGYDVILAKDGVDALKQMQDRIPDVVLSDIEMPRMDGFDLVRNIRGDSRLAHLPVVMISSRTADKHQNYARSLGVSAFLGKPYSEETLLGLLKDYTGDHRARKQAALA